MRPPILASTTSDSSSRWEGLSALRNSPVMRTATIWPIFSSIVIFLRVRATQEASGETRRGDVRGAGRGAQPARSRAARRARAPIFFIRVPFGSWMARSFEDIAQDEEAGDEVDQPMDPATFSGRELEEDVGDKAERDPLGDAHGQGHDDDAQEGRNGFGD